MTRTRNNRRARRVIAWGLGGYIAATVAVNVFIDRFDARPADMDYGRSLAALRARLEDWPDTPPVLVLGSSHVASGVVAGELTGLRDARGRAVPAFNLGRNGGSALFELAALHRLEAMGIRPAAVVAEVLPFASFGSQPENWTAGSTAVFTADLPVFAPLMGAGPLWSAYLSDRVAAVHTFRTAALYLIRPSLVPADLAVEWNEYAPRQLPLGGYAAPEAMAADPAALQFRNMVRRCVEGDDTVPGELEGRVLREIAGFCRERGIPLAFLVMPESTRFRLQISPKGRAELDSFLHALAADCGVRVADARNWTDDADVFDGHHMLRKAAVPFTRRLGREVIQPLLLGQLTPGFSASPPKPAPPVVYADWLDEFGDEGGEPGSRARWCGRDGTLQLENLTSAPLTRRLTLGVRTPAAGNQRLTIEGLASAALDIGEAEAPLTWTIAVPPGRHRIRFRCDGPPLDIPAPKGLVFQVTNFRMTEAD